MGNEHVFVNIFDPLIMNANTKGSNTAIELKSDTIAFFGLTTTHNTLIKLCYTNKVALSTTRINY